MAIAVNYSPQAIEEMRKVIPSNERDQIIKALNTVADLPKLGCRYVPLFRSLELPLLVREIYIMNKYAIYYELDGEQIINILLIQVIDRVIWGELRGVSS